MHASWLSLIPFLLVIPISILTRQVQPGLFIALLVGSYIMEPSLLGGVRKFLDYLYQTIVKSSNIKIILFLYGFSGLISVIKMSGGIKGFVEWVSKRIKTKRGALILTWVSTLGTFSDPDFRIVTVAPIIKALQQRLKLSKRRAAYIIDVTSNPVVALVPIATGFVGFMVSLIHSSFIHNGIKKDPYIVYIKSIPFNFFSFAILFVGLYYTFFMHPKKTKQDAADPNKMSENQGPSGGTLQPNPSMAQGGGVQQPNPSMVQGGGVQQPNPGMTQGGGVQQPNPSMAQGGGVQQPNPGMTQGGGVQQPNPGMTQGGGVQQPNPGMPQGGGVQQPNPGMTQGGGVQQPNPGMAQGGGVQQPNPGMTQGGGVQRPNPGMTQGGGVQRPNPGMTQGGGVQQPNPGMTQGGDAQRWASEPFDSDIEPDDMSDVQETRMVHFLARNHNDTAHAQTALQTNEYFPADAEHVNPMTGQAHDPHSTSTVNPTKISMNYSEGNMGQTSQDFQHLNQSYQEEYARHLGAAEVLNQPVQGSSQNNQKKGEGEPDDTPSKPLNLVIPIGLLILLTLFLSWWNGHAKAKSFGGAFLQVDELGVMLESVLITLIITIAMVMIQKFSTAKVVTSFINGGNQLMSVIVLLALIWGVSAVSTDLGFSTFITDHMKGWIPTTFVAPILFLFGVVLSYFIGSSWGTWGLLMPLGITLAHQSGANLLLVIGAVFASGTYGATCSPLSDNTVTLCTMMDMPVMKYSRWKLIPTTIGAGIALVMFIIASFIF